MILRPFLYEPTACASYLFGCTTHGTLAVVDPHVELVDRLPRGGRGDRRAHRRRARDARPGRPRLGLPDLVAATGATAYLPAGAEVDFDHRALEDGERVELGNTIVTAMSTPGHAPAHHAYVVADRRRGTEEPWLVFTGDSLLVNDVGRPDLHAGGGDPRPLALEQHASIARLWRCRTMSSSTRATTAGRCAGAASRATRSRRSASSGCTTARSSTLDAEAFADALLEDLPPAPPDQASIVAAEPRGSGRLQLTLSRERYRL